MLDPTAPKAAPSAAGVVARYADCLRLLSYRPGVVDAYVHAVQHFTSWLASEGVPFAQIQEALVMRFLEEHLPACRCPGRLQRSKVTVRAALRRLLRVLRAEGVISFPASPFSPAVRDDLEAFSRYLRQVCGLANNTVISRRQWIARFLGHQFPDASVNVAALTPGDLSGYLTTQCAGFQPGSVRVVCTALRSYLRFRAVQYGDHVDRLLAAVPTVAQWPLSTLPKHLPAEDVERWLKAFDRQSPRGKRDYAMARCLADLGLRACEVAALRLDDVNWAAGTMIIKPGKSRRTDTLLLPTATGIAIAQYLSEGRPQSSSRQLFIRHRAPLEEPLGPGLVRGAMRRAAARCDLPERWSGPHVMRHTVATRLLDGGASRKEIADLLRHRSLNTTAIYAKVDVTRLMQIAQPWPGGAQ